ncbi:MAG: helix-turn-helix domain-containing protein [Phycisphaerales bacterium JB058]
MNRNTTPSESSCTRPASPATPAPEMNTLEFLRLLAQSPYSRTQRDVLRTLLTFADLNTWKLWPSMSTIARAMGCDRRTVQRTVRVLHEIGILTTLGATRTGTCIMRIETGMLREVVEGQLPSSPMPESSTTTPATTTPTTTTTTPTTTSTMAPPVSSRPIPPGQNDAQTNQRTSQGTTHTTNQPTEGLADTPANKSDVPGPAATPEAAAVAAAVARILGSEALLSHPNATPERLAYISRVAPGKQNPAGFAASAIREGYDIVPPTRAELEAQRHRERENANRRFRAMPEDRRRVIWDETRRRYGRVLEQHNSARYREQLIARTMRDLRL